MTAESLVLALFDWAVRASVLFAAVAALLLIMRVKNAHLLSAAWTLALAIALCLPIARQLFPRLTLPLRHAFILPTLEVPKGRVLVSPIPDPLIGGKSDRVPLLVESHRGRYFLVAFAIWGLVALGMLSRVVIGVMIGARLVAKSHPVGHGFSASALVQVPVTFGLLRPVILLPLDWTEWDPIKLQAVLAHEGAHVARLDPLRLLAASVYRGLSWFNPLAWWLRKQLVELAEAACDDAALLETGDRVVYAETLIAFLARSQRRILWGGVSMASRGARGRRLERILNEGRRLSHPLRIQAMAALGLTAVLFLIAVAYVQPIAARASISVEALAPSSLPMRTQVSQVTLAPAQKQKANSVSVVPFARCGGDASLAQWTSAESSYLISQDEREAFEKLGSVGECAHFIQLFWHHRDPDPATSENEAKQEHVRRVNYSNANFRGTARGWRTDRGRIYITFGPPTEVDAHPQGESYARPAEQGGGTTSTYPFEKWKYRRIEGLGEQITFEFVDTNQNGEYRLAIALDSDGRAVLEGSR